METYSITDLIGYAECIRDSAAKSLNHDYEDDLNNYITINQVINLVKEKSLGLDSNDHYMINEDVHYDIHDDVEGWIFNVGLARLAAAGKIECAWDDKEDAMVFWASSNKEVNHHEDAENNGT